MTLFKKIPPLDYESILNVLENGDTSEIQNLFWQPTKKTIEYLPITYTTIGKLKKTSETEESLSIHKKFENKNFEIVFIHCPWTESTNKFHPIIFDKKDGKIVGYLLPFSELLDILPKKDLSAISDLGIEWIKFSLGIGLPE